MFATFMEWIRELTFLRFLGLFHSKYAARRIDTNYAIILEKLLGILILTVTINSRQRATFC